MLTDETAAVLFAEQLRAAQLPGHRAHGRAGRIRVASLRALPAGAWGWVVLALVVVAVAVLR